jgi:hypothetical protein
MKIRQLQQRVAVKLRGQRRDADLDILQGWHPYRLTHTDRGEDGGDCTDGVAHAVRNVHPPAMDRHRDQSCAVEH